MSDPYARTGSKSYYTSTDYVPGARQGQSDYHDSRDRLSDTQYPRSGDLAANRSTDVARNDSRRRSVTRYDDRYDDRNSDKYSDRDYDRRGDGGSRRDRDYDSPDRRSESDYEQKGRDAKQESKRRFKEKEEKLEGVVGKEQKDIAATVIGALAGGFLGYEAGHGRPAGALGGALLGGLAGNAIEHQHIKRMTDREKREKRYDSD